MPRIQKFGHKREYLIDDDDDDDGNADANEDGVDEEETLISAVPMVTMAQSAAN